MLGQRAQQMGALYAKPMEAREKYKDIFDPTRREALVAQAIGNVMAQLSGTGGLIEQQRGFAGQRAQTALDALMAQIGLAETAYEAASEKTDWMRDLLTKGAEVAYGEQYKPVSEEEWKDIEKQLGLQAAYRGGVGGAPPKWQVTMEEDAILGSMWKDVQAGHGTPQQFLDIIGEQAPHRLAEWQDKIEDMGAFATPQEEGGYSFWFGTDPLTREEYEFMQEGLPESVQREIFPERFQEETKGAPWYLKSGSEFISDISDWWKNK